MNAEAEEKTLVGFWTYLMTDCILFATLFATYAVLHRSTAGGPSAHDIVQLPFALTQTLLLLTSSFTCGLANATQRIRLQLLCLGLTFLCGFGFVFLEGVEFTHLVHEGNSWQRSAFLSSYFTLVATHGLHVSVGLLWMVILMVQLAMRGLNFFNIKRLKCLSMFWHFLDIIWIFLFTFVYLMGAAWST